MWNAATNRKSPKPTRRCTSQSQQSARTGNRGTILQIVSRMPLIKPLLAETQVADGNRRPHHQCGQAGNRNQRQIHRRSGNHGRQQRQQHPAMLNSTANTGTPWKFVLPSTRGIIPSCASDQTMREHTYKPEFAAESTAVNTTKFITSPANGMPIDWNTSTNGLVSTPDRCHGISADITAIEPMKKIARRNTVVCTAFGIACAGSFVSPAATPTTSVPENANTTVSSVEKSAAHHWGTSRHYRNSQTAVRDRNRQSESHQTWQASRSQ